VKETFFLIYCTETCLSWSVGSRKCCVGRKLGMTKFDVAHI